MNFFVAFLIIVGSDDMVTVNGMEMPKVYWEQHYIKEMRLIAHVLGLVDKDTDVNPGSGYYLHVCFWDKVGMPVLPKFSDRDRFGTGYHRDLVLKLATENKKLCEDYMDFLARNSVSGNRRMRKMLRSIFNETVKRQEMWRDLVWALECDGRGNQATGSVDHFVERICLNRVRLYLIKQGGVEAWYFGYLPPAIPVEFLERIDK